MNSVKKSYQKWSEIYDTNKNLTRDLDLEISEKILKKQKFNSVLEIGCGTGKNSIWLNKLVDKHVAVDFSPEMLKIAKNKLSYSNVDFIEADITKPWNFVDKKVDLVTINLVLEHVENLDFIFHNAFKVLNNNGLLFISELHPIKKILGSQAKFDNELVLSISHQISDYFKYAHKYNFQCIDLIEGFDNKKDKEQNIPRLISILFKK